jgi:hypothetical protein
MTLGSAVIPAGCYAGIHGQEFSACPIKAGMTIRLLFV